LLYSIHKIRPAAAFTSITKLLNVFLLQRRIIAEFLAGVPSKIINKTSGAEFTDPLEGFNHLNEVRTSERGREENVWDDVFSPWTLM
jgi:hypothetical protein